MLKKELLDFLGKLPEEVDLIAVADLGRAKNGNKRTMVFRSGTPVSGTVQAIFDCMVEEISGQEFIYPDSAELPGVDDLLN